MRKDHDSLKWILAFLTAHVDSHNDGYDSSSSKFDVNYWEEKKEQAGNALYLKRSFNERTTPLNDDLPLLAIDAQD